MEKDFELVVIWSNGDKDIYSYDTEEQAERGMEGMKMALGNQISWAGVRRSL